MTSVRRFFFRLVTLFRRGAAETDLAREINAHLQLLEDRFVAEGMPRADARVAARRALGGVEQVKELQRDARTFPSLAGWSTDLKLGARMLAKYPGLTIAGGLTLAIAIGLGAAWYDLSGEMFRPALSLPNGDRIVRIRIVSALTGDIESRVLHEYAAWRRQLRTLDEFGAFRPVERNAIVDAAAPEPITVAEMTASAFRIAGVAPLLGRTLTDEDERPGAPDVVVLGHEVWQRWFDGRADAIGRTLQLGTVTATVIGIMPDGFAFPVNHRAWTPLRVRPAGYAPLEGDEVSLVGRLRADASRAQAEAELAVLAADEARTFPSTHEHLRPRVGAYGSVNPGGLYFGLGLTHLPIVLVLFLACLNVGTLVYARTAMREGEIATRFAIGASRGRIIAQLFMEAIALVLVAGAVGLAAADWALTWGMPAYFSSETAGLPFWFEPGLQLTTVIYAATLAVAAAAVLSLLPALKATGPQVQARLATASGGRTTLQFGRVWTTAMVTQVAVTAFSLTPAIGITGEAFRDRRIREAFPGEQYLAATVDIDRALGESAAVAADTAGRLYAELERRVAREPGVRAVTVSESLPGIDVSVRRGELETERGTALPAVTALDMWTARVGHGYFTAFDKRIVAGRDFTEGDRVDGARTIIVNEAFARRVGGGTPVGRHVRYASSDAAAPQPWFEIVGVVEDIGMTPTDRGEAPYMFQAVALRDLAPAVMGVHTAGDPVALAPRVRVIAAEIDPRLRVTEAGSLEDWTRRADMTSIVSSLALIIVVSLGLFLSASGIFALVSVTLTRRTRELGLRSALGAGPGRLLMSIFLRVLLVVASGIVIGNGVLFLPSWFEDGVQLSFMLRPLGVTSAIILMAGLLACIGPARRILRISPTEALNGG
jgi:putative ABC transport system permease protein